MSFQSPTLRKLQLAFEKEDAARGKPTAVTTPPTTTKPSTFSTTPAAEKTQIHKISSPPSKPTTPIPVSPNIKSNIATKPAVQNSNIPVTTAIPKTTTPTVRKSVVSDKSLPQKPSLPEKPNSMPRFPQKPLVPLQKPIIPPKSLPIKPTVPQKPPLNVSASPTASDESAPPVATPESKSHKSGSRRNKSPSLRASTGSKSKRKISLPSLSRKGKPKTGSSDLQIITNGSHTTVDDSTNNIQPQKKQEKNSRRHTVSASSHAMKEIKNAVEPVKQEKQKQEKKKKQETEDPPITLVPVSTPVPVKDDELIVLPNSHDVAKPVLSKDPRENVVQELFETENGYVKDLDIIVNVYLRSIRESEILSAEEIAKLFSTVELLLPLHEEILAQLSKSPSVVQLTDKLKLGDPSCSVGKSFMKMSNYLKMYSQYCSNQEASTVLYSQLLRNKAFEELVYNLKCQPKCRNLDLPSYLIKPMQRVCKYPLLLRELIKQTPTTHPDYQDLQTAAAMISQTVSLINDSKKVLEESETLLSLQKKINYPKKFSTAEHPIISPGRKYVENGSCTYISHAFKSSTIRWYLFSDLLVITNARNQLKKYVPTSSALLGHVTIEGYDYAFEIIHCGTDKIWLATKTHEDRNRLRKIFADCGMIDRSSEAPVYSKLHEYASRPLPLPPGKFTQSFDGKNMDEIMGIVQTQVKQAPTPIDAPVKKRKSGLIISSPSNFRKGAGVGAPPPVPKK